MPRIRSGRVRNADAIENALTAEKRAVPVGVAAAAEPIQGYLETKVSIPFPPPSSPGQPAHLRTGKYKRGWNVKGKGLVLTILNPVRYAGFLEWGTKFMAARPALTRSRPGLDPAGRRLVRSAGRTAAENARRVRTTPGGGTRG